MGKNRKRYRSSSDDSDRDSLRRRLRRLERLLDKTYSKKYGSHRRSRSRRPRSPDRRRRDSGSYTSGSTNDSETYRGDRGYDSTYDGNRPENPKDRPRDENSSDNGQHQVRAASPHHPHESDHDDPVANDGSSIDNARNNDQAQQKENEPVTPLVSGEDATAGITLSPQAPAAPGAEVVANEVALESEVLQVMGDRLKPDRIIAPAIHKDLAIRFEEVINSGLPSDERKILLKKFPAAENCLFMDPPKLNLEIKASLQEALIKRDSRIVEKQERLTASLAGLTSLSSTVLQLTAQERLPMLEIIGGVMRLLCDLQHEESSIRRSLILKNIDPSMRETLKSVTADELLFGKNLDEKVKAVKSLELSSNRLKAKPRFSSHSNESKNSKGPPRHQPYKLRSYATSGGQKPSSNNQKYNRDRKPSFKQNQTPRNAKRGN